MNILTSDGHNIVFIHKNVNSDSVVLMCHGITSEKNESGVYDFFSRQVERLGIDTFRFDFRGHGDSHIPPMETTIAGMIIDLNTVLKYLSNRYDKIYLLAASFGASIVLLLKQNHCFNKILKICFWNPVTDYASTFTKTHLSFLKMVWKVLLLEILS
jgi:uncharacterized protein